jgi:hypothetical protein
MDSLMKVYKMNKINNLPLLSENQERNKFICLFNWLDTKLEITENRYRYIKRMDLQNMSQLIISIVGIMKTLIL